MRLATRLALATGVATLLAGSVTAEPRAGEIAPGPTCEAPNAGVLPHVPLDVVVDAQALARQQRDQGLVVLNNRGYGYRMDPTAQQPRGARPKPEPAVR